ncbi:hypothetical protein H632_c1830p1 [Helicosporidium sp. ATCC 50920]|nr:hypothetical protein H632_c1830p1 [Helicosporidium sp. ATCC 50920]|eukprot:KDD73797.1 hypothetical protein H632_c1830p1 [Helicosporidium sp. ATCC 50920]
MEEMRSKAEGVSRATGNEVGCSTADLLQPDQIRDMVAQVQSRYGRLDILVNNAGIQYVAPVRDFPEAKWEAIVGVVMNAPFHASKAALPAMLDNKWGRIVNTGSMHALVASPFKSAYNAAKHGVAGFTKTLALEVATTGVTVNAVCPGYVLTELIEKQLDDQAKTRGIPKERIISEVLLADQPIKRFVKPEEVGAMVRHLCSDDAAAVTGAMIAVDGGWTAR